jgi:hypothetical protein
MTTVISIGWNSERDTDRAEAYWQMRRDISVWLIETKQLEIYESDDRTLTFKNDADAIIFKLKFG